MILSPETRELARRLLAYEAGLRTTSEPMESPAYHVCEKLRRSLSALAGVAGFQALISRALTLARAETSSLAAVKIAPDGSLEGLDQIRGENGQFDEGGSILIGQLLELLLTFIGEALTLRLIEDVWPNGAFDDRNAGKGTQA